MSIIILYKMKVKKLVLNVNTWTNYKIEIVTNKNNYIKLSIEEESQFGSMIIKNMDNYAFSYYNDDKKKITIIIEYIDENYKINIKEDNIKIKQIHINDDLKLSFMDDIKKLYHLQEYNNDYEPAIFYGLIKSKDIEILEKNKSLKIIIWIGGDINFKINRTPKISKLIKKNIDRILAVPKIKHISISSFISTSLTELHLPFKMIPFMGVDFDRYKPIPKGQCIYLYTSLGCEQYYGYDYYKLIMEKYKHIRFIVTCCSIAYGSIKNKKATKYGIRYYTKEQLINDIYPQCFIGLRLTDHDGLSATVQELGLMGIKCVHNGCSPSALNYNSFDDICHHIDIEYKKIGQTDHSLANQVKKYLTIDPNFFNSEFHK
ncbi:hypothetical protein QJ856_gp0841 [Tupanvirus deep ocean]|uniref:Uncharacterized protein n=2 Tax=Tupanvirus TaxID=2094720 RepID=A0AC62A808_9VIRU|nr:hypothetical protein QJ856_gp0841 [Tupanvirus deep ocean]QKU33914.1 hypothetical protein [Tupanvirus deep ocean]